MVIDRKRIRQIELRHAGITKKLHGDWVVWWYGAVKRNHRVKTLPLVIVWFRRLLTDNSLGAFEQVEVGITELALLQIGTIWSNGRCSQIVPLEEREFTINFSDHGWSYTSQYESHRSAADLIPQNLYSLPVENRDRSELLVFRAGGSGKLVVPCLEFFSRCYGRSSEINRILCTYPWSEAEGRLSLPIPAESPRGSWPVCLPSKLNKDDALIVAHMKYDDFARTTAKSIYSNLESRFSNGNPLAFPRIRPWYVGPATLIVEGISTGEGAFLALRIAGCSEPKGPPIVNFRDGSAEESSLAEEATESIWAAANRRASELAYLVSISSTNPAGHDSDAVELLCPSLRIVGTRRMVTHEKLQSESISRRPSMTRSASASERYASGEREGTDNTTGLISVRTETELESKGAVRDVWDALIYLHSAHPDIVKSVEWYSTLSNQAHSSDEGPFMVSLPPYERRVDDDFNSTKKSWIYANSDRTRLRGVLIAIVRSAKRSAYFFEVERRPCKRVDKNGVLHDDEQSYSGLVASPPMDNDPAEWIPKVLVGIRDKAGIMAHVASSHCSGLMADFYRRSTSKQDRVAGHSTVVNALAKVGIAVPKA